ncbi:MAG: flagellar protein FlgN [Halieaceae bacterium]|nr:flagellar protein FlgN [Halieaceae bacterium]
MTDFEGYIVALERELLTLSAVHEALLAETAALIDGNTDHLGIATTSKNAALEAHQAALNQRPAGDLSEGTSAALRALQDRLASLAGECQELNRRNGALISKLSDRTKAALTVLQGTEDIAVLYSASGVEAATSKGSRVLGKA